MLDNAETIGFRVSQIIEELVLTNNSFAAKLRAGMPGYKITHTTIGRYIANEYEPKPIFYKAVEKVFGYSEDWIRSGRGDKKSYNVEVVNEIEISYLKTFRAPIYGHVYCGTVVSQWNEGDVKKRVTVDSGDKTAFGLIARGDSMRPYINPMDTIICVDNPSLIKDKTAVVVVFKSEPETLEINAKLIKWDKKKKTILLYSINTNFPPETYNESEILKIYKVVEIRRKVK